MSKRKTLTRRGFLKGAAAAGATSVFGAGSARSRIVHAAALGADGNVAPSNRIALAAIGIGIQGTVNMAQFLKKKDVQLVAVCDVDEGHRDEAKSMVDQVYGNEDCKAYSDFRELIGRDDLDAVARLHIELRELDVVLPRSVRAPWRRPEGDAAPRSSSL